MALLKALGYPAQPDPLTSVEQGYAASSDYYECYKNGPGYGNFRFPNTLDNRYFHEDMGMGLVFFCSLGKVLGVPTPVSETIVRMGEAISGEAYFQKGARTVEALGLAGLDREGIRDNTSSPEFVKTKPQAVSQGARRFGNAQHTDPYVSIHKTAAQRRITAEGLVFRSSTGPGCRLSDR